MVPTLEQILQKFCKALSLSDEGAAPREGSLVGRSWWAVDAIHALGMETMCRCFVTIDTGDCPLPAFSQATVLWHRFHRPRIHYRGSICTSGGVYKMGINAVQIIILTGIITMESMREMLTPPPPAKRGHPDTAVAS